jgi:signal transduction histidine kinase
MVHFLLESGAKRDIGVAGRPPARPERTMTLRLVGLMSVVLLLSLAAFGLLMSHYHKGFMEELPRTVSAVGQATLRTLDWHDSTGEVVAIRGLLLGRDGHAGGPPRVERRVRNDAHSQAEADKRRIERIEHVITATTEDNTLTIRESVVYPGRSLPSTLPGDDGRLEACLREALPGRDGQFFIDVRDVRAESDPLHGLIMTIPKFTPTEGEKPPQAGTRYEVHTTVAESDVTAVLPARRDDLRVPVPLGQYEELFQRFRSRSLFVFVGVFAVGMALSTGLATRFTRPVRQLDAGIRRLSAGDLDVVIDAPARDEMGRLARTFNEMAARLRANREREREMVRREKLSALGRLAAGVAHDVRNPLHSIGLTLQHLSETARPGEAARAEEFDRAVDVIRGEIRRLDRLVGNFLRFAKSDRRQRTAIDLGELLRETVRLVQKEAEMRSIRVELAADAATPEVLADGEAVRSAVLNLVLNSFEAMPGGGTLTLTLRAEGPDAILEVADTGEGIPAEHQEHIFDFAYTTREGGNGLGLAVVHHCIVEEHGGRIDLESSPGQGTRVRIALPVRGHGNGRGEA